MKFKLIAVLGAVAVVVSFTMPSFGASKSGSKSRAHATTSSVARAANGAACTGPCNGTSCARLNGATKTSSAVKLANGVTCPVSDPSQCPASCRNEHSGAVAANLKSR